MVYNSRFYLAIVLIIFVVLVIGIFIYSFMKKPKANDFDVSTQFVKPVVNKPRKSLRRDPVSKEQPARRLMPGA